MTDISLIEKRVGLAYSKLGIREPFIAAVMSKIKREVTSDVPTAATNGSWVKFNPDFVFKCTDSQLFGLTLHEALHVVLMHMWRREGRDPRLWNYSNDAIINAYIRKRGYELPDGGVFVDWVTESMSSEEVYQKLKDNPPPPPDKPDNPDGEGEGEGEGSDSPYPAGGFDGSGDIEDAVNEATKADLEATIVASAKMAKECGQGSGLIDRILEDIGSPKVAWADVLRNMLSESAKDDYTFQRPRRRFVSQGIYLPSLHSDALGGLLIGADTSGSMWGNPKELAQVCAEINAIVSDTRPAFVEVVYCDSQVQRVDRFEQGDEIVFKPPQGGGTRFKPVFDHLEESMDDYCGMIYFTDLYGDLDELMEPSIPCVWGLTHGKDDVPFGIPVPVQL